jgi:hypothetical protein
MPARTHIIFVPTRHRPGAPVNLGRQERSHSWKKLPYQKDRLGMALTPRHFIARWQANIRTEKNAAPEHFLDLCAILGQPTPA